MESRFAAGYEKKYFADKNVKNIAKLLDVPERGEEFLNTVYFPSPYPDLKQSEGNETGELLPPGTQLRGFDLGRGAIIDDLVPVDADGSAAWALRSGHRWYCRSAHKAVI